MSHDADGPLERAHLVALAVASDEWLTLEDQVVDQAAKGGVVSERVVERLDVRLLVAVGSLDDLPVPQGDLDNDRTLGLRVGVAEADLLHELVARECGLLGDLRRLGLERDEAAMDGHHLHESVLGRDQDPDVGIVDRRVQDTALRKEDNCGAVGAGEVQERALGQARDDDLDVTDAESRADGVVLRVRAVVAQILLPGGDDKRGVGEFGSHCSTSSK